MVQINRFNKLFESYDEGQLTDILNELRDEGYDIKTYDQWYRIDDDDIVPTNGPGAYAKSIAKKTVDIFIKKPTVDDIITIAPVLERMKMTYGENRLEFQADDGEICVSMEFDLGKEQDNTIDLKNELWIKRLFYDLLEMGVRVLDWSGRVRLNVVKNFDEVEEFLNEKSLEYDDMKWVFRFGPLLMKIRRISISGDGSYEADVTSVYRTHLPEHSDFDEYGTRRMAGYVGPVNDAFRHVQKNRKKRDIEKKSGNRKK